MKLIHYMIACLLLISINTHAYNLSSMAQEYVKKAEEAKKDNNNEQALIHYRNAVALNPNDFMLIFNLANELYNNGLYEEALTYYDRALALRSNVEQVYFNKGIILTQLEKHDQAADCFMQAINTNPRYTKAYTHAGHAFEKANKHDQAIDIYTRGIEVDFNNADLNYRLALVYRHKDLFHEAIQELRNAMAKNPKNVVYKLELANTLHLVDASEEALRLYEEILEIYPNNHHVLYNLGYTIKKLGYIEKALEIYNKVLEIDPDYALARFSRALTYLTLGNWAEGWKEYEWRWKAYNETSKKFDAPLWDGSNLMGKRILLYAEQGLGDTVQFVRYAKLVKEMGAYIIFETQSPLKDLLKLCPYLDEVYARGEKLPHFDLQISLMSLPMIFNTEITNTPEIVPYIYAKKELVTYWAEQVKHDRTIKIGICWQGNPNYSTQFLRQAVASKSMHVKHFEPLARLQGVTLYNLQKMGGEDQLKELSSDVNIVTFDGDFDNSRGRFMDTLGLMKNLDLIITVDTGTCHVAAALGVPTWNLLPNPADWRWMIDRTDTPWYNNMRLFKQPAPGDWDGAIQACIKALKPILRGEKTIEQVTQEKGHTKEVRPYEVIMKSKQLAELPQEQLQQQSTSQLHRFNTSPFNFESLDTQNIATESSATPTEEETALTRKASIRPDHTSTPTQASTPKQVAVQNVTTNAHPQAKAAREHPYAGIKTEDLTTELVAINKKLAQYDQTLTAVKHSVFNDQFMDLMQEALAAYNQKKVLKGRIKQAQDAHLTTARTL